MRQGGLPSTRTARWFPQMRKSGNPTRGGSGVGDTMGLWVIALCSGEGMLEDAGKPRFWGSGALWGGRRGAHVAGGQGECKGAHVVGEV